MEKVHFQTRISKEVKREFMLIIQGKHGIYHHGDISKYTEIAIREFNFKNRKQQQTTKNTQSPKTKEYFNTLELWEQLVKAYQNFESYGTLERGMVLKEIPLKQTMAKIKNVKYDKTEHRSVDAWIKKLIEHEFIRIHGPHMYQVLFSGTNWFEQGEKETVTKQKQQEFDIMIKGYDTK
jgi:hypothetical protein